jgi:hypothetical protein
MHTPSAALALELWRRHRPRLLAIAGLLLGFALVYPTMCALAGFSPNSPDALDELVRVAMARHEVSTLLRVGLTLSYMFLLGGPECAMFLSILCVIWMFTFIEFDPKSRNPMTFPVRIFTLPISTTFLFSWLLLGGLAAVVLLSESWVYFVPLPHLEVFGEYEKCFGWMTLLALAQGIVWALASWPITRILVLLAVLFLLSGFSGLARHFRIADGFAGAFSARNYAGSSWPAKDEARPMARMALAMAALGHVRPWEIART